jgi:hypothetical protein
MKLHEIKKRVIILSNQQQRHIKGGTSDSTAATDVIVIGDIDSF